VAACAVGVRAFVNLESSPAATVPTVVPTLSVAAPPGTEPFLSSFPVVVSNRAKAPFVALAGPTTLPEALIVTESVTASVVIVILVPATKVRVSFVVSAMTVDCPATAIFLKILWSPVLVPVAVPEPDG